MKNGIMFFAAGVNSDVINSAAGWKTQDLVVSKVSVDIYDSTVADQCYKNTFAGHSNSPGVISTQDMFNITVHKLFWEYFQPDW
jgi:hypothetical protein